MSKSTKSVWWRYVLQFGVLAFIVYLIVRPLWGGAKPDVEAYCPFGGLQAFGSYLHNNSLACSMSMVQIAAGFGLALCVLLAGRLFCGYICPLGTVSEWLGKGGKAMHCNVTIRSGSVLDRALRIVKYVLLFVILYYSISSSELFCKKFDPYYALATGMKGEITMWMSIVSIAVLFLGSLFVKQFWCKYICALGALSNIFKYTLTFVAIVLICWVAGVFKVDGAWVWIIGATCLICYIYEMTTLKSAVLPLMRIVRDKDKCTNCGLCQTRCPYDIPVQTMGRVKHIDCTMCTECVGVCNREALSVCGSRRLRWLPAAILVVVAALAIWLGGKYELPTIDEHWGDTEQVANVKTFEMTGLTSIKCFGSSKAFSAKMQTVDGVLGVKTFVRTHTVVVTYDADKVTEQQIEEAIFTPTMRKYSDPVCDELKVYQLGIEGLHDRNDVLWLGMMLQFREGIYGFEATYACPVRVMLYTDPSVEFTRKSLAEIIEAKEFSYPPQAAEPKTYNTNFELKSFEQAESISADQFVDKMFEPIAQTAGRFIENCEQWGSEPTAIYEMEMKKLEKLLVRNAIPYLKSYLSTCDGVLGFEPVLRDRVPYIRIEYVASMLDDQKIWAILSAESWTLRYADGSLKESDPKMTFDNEGKTVEQ